MCSLEFLNMQMATPIIYCKIASGIFVSKNNFNVSIKIIIKTIVFHSPEWGPPSRRRKSWHIITYLHAMYLKIGYPNSGPRPSQSPGTR